MGTCDNLNITVEEISDDVELVLSISRYILTFIGVLANLTVIAVFINCKIYSKCFTYTLILQQALIDLTACALYLILFNYPVPDGDSGVVYCKCRAIFWVFASASTFNLVYISIERYIAVVHPLKYWARGEVKLSTLPQLCVPFLFAIVVVFQLAITSRPDELSPGKCRYCHSSELVRLISGGSIFLLNWIIPISVMAFCYRHVYVTMNNRPKIGQNLRSKSISLQSTDDTGVSADGSENADKNFTVEDDTKTDSPKFTKAQKNFIITMAITTFVFLLSISPLIILYLVYVLCDCFDYDRHPLRQGVIMCFVLSLTANPFVYAFKFNEFKSGIKKTFLRNAK